MTVITYGGRAVALAGRHRFLLARHVAERPDGDPLKTFVCFLAAYARDVLVGDLLDEPSRYSPRRAERYARECLIRPHEFRALAGYPDARLAVHFNVPVEQIGMRRADLATERGGRRSWCQSVPRLVRSPDHGSPIAP